MLKSFYYYYLGRLNEALSELDKAAPVFREHLGTLSFLEQLRALIYYDIGEYGLSRESLKRMIDLRMEYFIKEGYPVIEGPFNTIYHYCLGRIDLKEGFVDSAKSQLTEIEAIANNNEKSRKYAILRAEILLAEKSFEKAIAICDKILPTELSSIWPGVILYYNIDPRDLLAQIYKEKGDINKAIAEYERLITFDPNSKERFLIHPRFHYELAKLYEDRELTEKAVREYDKFLELWKNADDTLPEKIDAQKRLANLKKAN